jgi:deoxyribodipyrimidine photo-lyase
VYSPYLKNWLTHVNGSLPHYLEDCPVPKPNNESVRSDEKFKMLFETVVPDCVEGFELTPDDKSRMNEVWPAGEVSAKKVRLHVHRNIDRT